jgi:hypothetical protein
MTEMAADTEPTGQEPQPNYRSGRSLRRRRSGIMSAMAVTHGASRDDSIAARVVQFVGVLLVTLAGMALALFSLLIGVLAFFVATHAVSTSEAVACIAVTVGAIALATLVMWLVLRLNRWYAR